MTEVSSYLINDLEGAIPVKTEKGFTLMESLLPRAARKNPAKYIADSLPSVQAKVYKEGYKVHVEGEEVAKELSAEGLKILSPAEGLAQLLNKAIPFKTDKGFAVDAGLVPEGAREELRAFIARNSSVASTNVMDNLERGELQVEGTKIMELLSDNGLNLNEHSQGFKWSNKGAAARKMGLYIKSAAGR